MALSFSEKKVDSETVGERDGKEEEHQTNVSKHVDDRRIPRYSHMSNIINIFLFSRCILYKVKIVSIKSL